MVIIKREIKRKEKISWRKEENERKQKWINVKKITRSYKWIFKIIKKESNWMQNKINWIKTKKKISKITIS